MSFRVRREDIEMVSGSQYTLLINQLRSLNKLGKISMSGCKESQRTSKIVLDVTGKMMRLTQVANPSARR
jgi:hypothetical protein